MAAVGRKIRDRAEAIELLSTWEASGERMSTWCQERGLNWYSLSTHRNWLRAEQRGHATVRMVEVEVDAPIATTYRIDLGGVVVEVDDNFRDDTLRRLVDVLGAC
jgi:hypothetical protein